LKSTELSLHEIPHYINTTKFKYIELLKHYNFITTASVVFRKLDNFKIPHWFNKIPFGDLGLYKLVSKHTKIMCIDEVMSVYRLHENGIYTSLNKLQAMQNYLNFYKVIFTALNPEEKQVVISKKKEVIFKISKLKFPRKPLVQKIYNKYLLLKNKNI
ncbi:MAG: hypothetical protein ACPG6B_03760, partial [Oceanihabitans sp.]